MSSTVKTGLVVILNSSSAQMESASGQAGDVVSSTVYITKSCIIIIELKSSKTVVVVALKH